MVTYNRKSIGSEGKEEVRNVEESTGTCDFEIKDEPVLVVLFVLDGKPNQIRGREKDEGKVWQAQSTNRPLISSCLSVKKAKSTK